MQPHPTGCRVWPRAPHPARQHFPDLSGPLAGSRPVAFAVESVRPRLREAVALAGRWVFRQGVWLLRAEVSWQVWLKLVVCRVRLCSVFRLGSQALVSPLPERAQLPVRQAHSGQFFQLPPLEHRRQRFSASGLSPETSRPSRRLPLRSWRSRAAVLRCETVLRVGPAPRTCRFRPSRLPRPFRSARGPCGPWRRVWPYLSLSGQCPWHARGLARSPARPPCMCLPAHRPEDKTLPE